MPVTPGAYITASAAFPTRLGLALVFCCSVGACSVDIPIPGFAASDITASLETDAARLSPAMAAGDWALARTALKAALEAPTSGGRPAAWGNPSSGLHGVFSRDPDPKAQWLADGAPKDAASCQYFIASIAGAPEPVEREGLACRDKEIGRAHV